MEAHHLFRQLFAVYLTFSIYSTLKAIVAMSLFPSAFESGVSKISPTLASAGKGGKKTNKRKHSDANAGLGQAQQVKQADANFEKLMRKFEGGEAIGKEEGKESMGVVGKKRNKKNKSRQVNDEEIVHSTPRAKGDKPKPKPTPKSDQAKLNQAAKQNQTDTPPSKKSKADKITPGFKPEPVQLPIPIPPPSKGTKLKVGGEGNLTEMQKDMQAKLEGARFRWVPCQLVLQCQANVPCMIDGSTNNCTQRLPLKLWK